MNKNFIKVMYPGLPQGPTHYLSEDTFFVRADYKSFAPKGKFTKPIENQLIAAKSEVILVEYGLGYKNLWSKVFYNEELIYVYTKFLVAKEETLNKYRGFKANEDFLLLKNKDDQTCLFPFSKEKEYQPNEYTGEEYWKDKKPNIVYDDAYSGNFAIHYEDLYTTEVNGDNDVREKIKQACYQGTSLILKSKGFRYDIDYVKFLVDNFIIFSRAEEYYFPIRPCSTLRVLVTVPKRLIFAKIGNKYVLEANKEPVIEEIDLQPDVEQGENIDIYNLDGTIQVSTEQPNTNIVKLTYADSFEFDMHCATINLSLWYCSLIFHMPPLRIWTVQPDTIPNRGTDTLAPGAIDMAPERSAVSDFFITTNNFIYENLFNQLTHLQDEGKQNYKDIFRTENINSEEYGSLTTALAEEESKIAKGRGFKGRLELYIDKFNLELVDIKLFSVKEETGEEKEIYLNVNTDAFLKDASIINKTALNYLITVESIITKLNKFVELDKQLAEQGFLNLDANGIKEWFNELKQKALDLFEGKVTSEQFRSELADQGKMGAKFLGGLINKIDLIAAIVEEGAQVNKDIVLRNFLTTKHYPIITSVSADPVDFGACADKFGTTPAQRTKAILDSNDPEIIFKTVKNLRKDISKARKVEGSSFTQAIQKVQWLSDDMKVVLGQKPLPGPKTYQKIGQYLDALNRTDFIRFLNEALTCAGLNFDPERFSNIMNDFEQMKYLLENPDLLLLCNPVAKKIQQTVGSILELIKTLEIPTLPIYDPNEALANALRELIANIVSQLVIFTIRYLITGSLRNCTADKNPDFNLGNGVDNGNISDLNLGIDNAENNRDTDAFLNEFFGNLNEEGETLEQTRARLKLELKAFLEDVAACLTTLELCNLLTGVMVNDEIYEIIFSILKRKYNNPNKKYNLASKLNDKEYLTNFFLRLGTTYNLEICNKLLNMDSPYIPTRFRCDDGRKEIRERTILKNKGIPDDLIDDLIKDLKDKDEQDLRSVLEFLNNDDPFNLDKIPTVLCKVGPNGEVIPPLVSLAPSLKSFKGMLDDLYRPVYDAFDEEAPNWYKSTYTVSASSGPKSLFKIENNEMAQADPPEDTVSDEEKRKALEDKKIPNFVFNQILTDGSIKFNETSYKVSIDGEKLQKFENKIDGLKDDIRINVNNFNADIKTFCESFLFLIDTYKLGNISNPEIDNFKDISEDTKDFMKKEFSDFLKLVGTYYANTVAVINDPDKNGIVRRVLNFTPADYANALFTENEGALPSMQIYSLLQDPIFVTKLKNIISLFAAGEGENNINSIAIEDASGSNVNYSHPSSLIDTIVSTYQTSASAPHLQIAAAMMSKYPSYDASLTQTNLQIKKSLITGKLELYDQYDLKIVKNGYDFISSSIDSKCEDGVLDYITSSYGLALSLEQIQAKNKKDLFDAFVERGKQKYPNQLLTQSFQKQFKTTKDEIFDDFNLIDEYKDLDFQSILNNISSPTDVLNLGNIITDTGPSLKANYSAFARILNGQISDNISSSLFNKILESSAPVSSKQESINDYEEPFVKPPDAKNPPKTQAPYTQYFSLLHIQTPQQKACKIRPHYLDIDNIKDEAADKKEDSYCLEEVKNEKIKSGQEISTAELADVELSDTQIILLESTFRLLIRTHLHEHILKAIPVFGYYDPQTLRKDNIFISYLTDFFEADLRAVDNTVYMMMAKFFARTFAKRQQVGNSVPNPKILIKEVIKDELKNIVLPKLAKRINEDTNGRLNGVYPPKRIDLHNLSQYYDESLNLLRIDPYTKSVYIRVTGAQFKRTDLLGNESLDNLKTFILKREAAKSLPAGSDSAFEMIGYTEQQVYYQKIYESNTLRDPIIDGEDKVKSEIIREFANQQEYKLLFNLLFPRTQTLSFMFMTAALSSMTKKENASTFTTTKSIIRRLIKEMASGGSPIVADLNNVQDMINLDNTQIAKEFIIRMLIMTPLMILKGYAEITETSITIGNGVHTILKLIYELIAIFEPRDPEFKKDPQSYAIQHPGTVIAPPWMKSSLISPAIFVPLGIWQTSILGPLMIKNLYVWLAYLGLGLWIDEDDELNKFSPMAMLEKALEPGATFDSVTDFTGEDEETEQEDPCANVPNPDRIDLKNEIFDGELGYSVDNPINLGLKASDSAIAASEAAIQSAKEKADQQRQLKALQEMTKKFQEAGLPLNNSNALAGMLKNKIDKIPPK